MAQPITQTDIEAQLKKAMQESRVRAQNFFRTAGGKQSSAWQKANEVLLQIKKGGKQFGSLPQKPKEDAELSTPSEMSLEERFTGKSPADVALNPALLRNVAVPTKAGEPSALQQLEARSMYSHNPVVRYFQQSKALRGIKQDFRARSRTGGGKGPNLATNIAGRIAGGRINKIAESDTVVSQMLIYGLALLNDLPDLGEPLLALVSFGSSEVIDFLYDVVVILGFRFFLRKHVNTPMVKWLIYGAGGLELIPVIGVIPFWTLCAWLALRAVHQEKEATEAEEAQTAGAGQEAQNVRGQRLQAVVSENAL